MPLTIERLRAAIVALAVLLLLAIVGSFFYGRWRIRHITQDLPARLGLQIQQSTQGFSLSRSNSQGRTLFTLHAARAVEFKSGARVSLHDVKIELYGEDGVADTIAGDDFEFDPHSQIVRSDGEAHLILHPPANGAAKSLVSRNVGQTVRVTTHGLIFNQKTGVATCSGEVDFQIADSGGQAVGATFDSKQGQMLLASQVVLTTKVRNRPAVLHATRAVYDRNQNEVHLSQPRYSSGTQSGVAGSATVLLRANGSAERLDARDGVRLTMDDGMEVRASSMQVALDERNQPQQAHFNGGVAFKENQPTENVSGNARQAQVDFDAAGRAKRVILDGAVKAHQRTDSGKSLLQRTLLSDRLNLQLLPSKTGNAQLKSADADGNAVFTSESQMTGRAPQVITLAGQVLNADFAAANQLRMIHGRDQTRLKMVAANGDTDTSTGDTLQIEFAPSAPTKGVSDSTKSNGRGMPAESIRNVVQTGHVILQQMAHGNNAATSGPVISTATAGRAFYLAAEDTLTLTGQPIFRDAQLEITAGRMELERGSKKMIAVGAVQTTLRSGDQRLQQRNGGGALLDSKQSVHIIAERATVMHDTQTAVFSGRARLWQGGDTIDAPVIELAQKAGTLIAHGDSSCTQCVVGNFVGQPASSANGKQPSPPGPSTFRVLSERLTYSDAERKASFVNHVQVSSSSGQLLANNVEFFLTPADKRPAARPRTGERNTMAQSSVEQIVATGDVRLLQPGRSASGSRLVYTAADGHFVLTGDAKSPPLVVDADRGTVTGQVLTFATREQAIMVSGTSAHTTTTKTRVKKR